MQLTTIDKTVSSICPVCFKVLSAHISLEDGNVVIAKRCEEHGEFSEVYWSDAALYERFNKYWFDGSGVDNSVSSTSRGCPYDCGLCQNHKTSTLLGNIDVTNRCNLACPICFANAGGRIYEPTAEQIRAMMHNLRSERPAPCPAIQFSGGEPTIRDDLPQLLDMARQMGFSQIQIATNGIRLAESMDFCKALVHSGLNTTYLQFDGVTAEPYKIARGRDLLSVKKKAIDNLRKAGQSSVVLVPTLAKGVNDDQVGGIIKFASDNLEIVKGVNFQPVSFSGRIDQTERAAQRITIPDLLKLIEDQTDNEVTRDDFYPVPFVAPISKLITAETGWEQPVFTVHPCCGAATYAYRYNGGMIPITRFLDVEGLLEKINKEVKSFDGSSLGKLKMKGMILKDLPKFIDETQVPRDLNITKLLLSVFVNGTRESLIEFHNRTLFLGVMHFQDPYNMDLERLQRCGVHYATPDGRIIPFCSYNTIHRKDVEARFYLPEKDEERK
jgi:uncharacterized radical SAM superfamily Fe-S cluster-containing enzyme